MKKMQRALVLLLSALMLLSLFGCAAQESTQPSQTAQGETAAVRDDIVYVLSGDVNSFDPCGSGYMNDIQVMRQIYDTLIRIHDDTGEVEPRIAESWETSEDGKDWTFHIRKGIKFHNGNELTAKDVAFSYNRALGSVIGGLVSTIESAEVVDDYTCVIHLKAPYAAALRVFDCRVRITPDGMEDGYETNPIGCGPYKFVSYTSGDSVVLEAFDDYYGGVPEIKHVTFKIITDKSTAIAALEAGEVDVVAEPALDQKDIVESNPQLVWATGTSAREEFVVLNVNRAPTDDLNVRRAIQYGIDYDAVNYGTTDGTGVVLNTVFPESLVASPEKEYTKPYSYDLEKAQEYLNTYKAEHNVDTVPIEMQVNNSSDMSKAWGTIVADCLRKVGFDVNFNVEDRSVFNSRMLAVDYEMLTSGTNLPIGDSDNLWQLMCSESASGYTGYKNEEMDELLNYARTTTDGEEARREAYKRVMEINDEVGLFIPLIQTPNNVAYNKDLQGFVPHGMNWYWMEDFHW